MTDESGDRAHDDLNGTEPGGDGAAHDAIEAEIEELRRRIQALQVDADKRLRELVTERPFFALGAAVAVGFVLGRALRRL